MTRVTILEYPGRPDPWRAANVLLFTKNTRLQMSLGLMSDIEAWSEDKKTEQLSLAANTNPGSHEFVDYTFLLANVTRAFTHQLVRTRTASYAQQTQMILSVRGFTAGEGGLDGENLELYRETMRTVARSYDLMLKNGAKVEDARGVLPTHIHTNLVVKMNMRTLGDFLRSRVSPRNMGEMADVAREMRAAVLAVHPWAALFLDRTSDRAAADLDAEIGRCVSDPETRTRMLKLVDQMRVMS